MPNFGIGIGSFLQGLTQGMALKNKQDQQKIENDLSERKMKLAEANDARDAEKDAFTLKKAQKDLANEQADRAANEPIKAAQRKSVLAGLADQNAERAAKAAAGAEAQKAFKANPGKYSSMSDAFREVALPRLQQFYLSKGDTASADGIKKWAEHDGVQSAIHDYGQMQQAFHLGDWDGVNKHLNKMMKNTDYVSQDHHDIRAEPIKDKDGKIGGIRVKYKDKTTGTESERDFTNMDEFHQFASVMTSPQAAFEQARNDYAAHVAVQSEKAKNLNKLANDITLEGVKSQNKMDEDQLRSQLRVAEEFAKNQGYQNPKEFANSTRDMIKNMADNDMLKAPVVGEDGKSVLKSDGSPKMRAMTADEAVAAAANLVHQTNMAARQQGHPTQGVIPQQTQAGRTIMPRGSQQGPLAAPPPRRQVPLL